MSSPVLGRYRGFRDQYGHHLPEFYQLLAVQLTFVIIFEVCLLLWQRPVLLSSTEGSPVSLPQHFVFAIGRLIDLMVPDIPEDVQMKIRREHYMAKEALAENQVRVFQC